MISLMDELPRHYRRSPQDAELQRVLGLLMEQLRVDKELTLRQLCPSTASGWGLELWERAWGIPVDYTQTEERRRERILAKGKGTGTSTLGVVKGIAQIFSTYPVEVVEETALYRFVIWYIGTIAPITHPEDLAAVINELKPAHLEWEVKYRKMILSNIYVGCLPRQAEIFQLKQVN